MRIRVSEWRQGTPYRCPVNFAVGCFSKNIECFSRLRILHLPFSVFEWQQLNVTIDNVQNERNL